MVQGYNLNYNNFSENICLSYKAVREQEHFTDVLLACDDGEINAHKIVLFTGSEFFQKLLPRFKHPHPLIYLKGLKVRDLESILSFVYFGEISLQEQDLKGVLNAAKDLKIKGFTDLFATEGKFSSGDSSDVSGELDDLLNTISEETDENNDCSPQMTDIDTDTEEDAQSSDKILDNEAVLELMMKNIMEDGRVSWSCSKCSFSSRDKSRTKRHVKGLHLHLHLRGNSDVVEGLVKTEMEAEDIEALELMQKDFTDDGKVSWRCLKCEFCCNDKCRTRKHVKSNHLKKHPVVGEDTDSHDKSVSKVELDAADMEALEMMVRELTEEGKVNWRCSTCQFSSHDKSRTRRHVKGKHIKTEDTEQASFLDTSVNKVEMDVEDQAALQLMVRLKTEEGVKMWQCTVCDRQHQDKTRIRKHIKNTHV